MELAGKDKKQQNKPEADEMKLGGGFTEALINLMIEQ
jgi:hypothetical protein